MQFLSDLAFIITRHVSKPAHKDMWKECIRCIREHYPEAPIIIVDDKSDQTLIEPCEYVDANVTTIQSEFQGAGEMLAYYYYYKLRPTEKACIIHDSMIIQRSFDNDTIQHLENVKYFWEFPTYCTPLFDKKNTDYVQEQYNILYNLNHNTELINHFFSQHWKGCFGVASLITLTFLDTLQEKYNIFKMISYINDRDDRQVSERSFGIITTYELKNQNKLDLNNISLYADICASHPHAFKYTFDHYISSDTKLNIPIIKCWSGR